MARGKRRRKRIGIGLRIIRFILLLALFLGLLGAGIYYFCTLKTVTVEGTELYTDKEIEEYLLDDEYCTNTVYAFGKNLLFPKGNAEFIDHFEVKMTGIHSINIKAVEKVILGYIADDGTYLYFDYNGDLVEISEAYVDGYMKLNGLIVEEPQIGEALPIGEDKVGFLIACIKLVQKNDLMPEEIFYDDYGRMTLVYDNYKISLGNSSYLEEKISRLSYILPQIEGMSGTLHLENFSSDNTDIVFEKDVEPSE